jgi:hypothetical protein
MLPHSNSLRTLFILPSHLCLSFSKSIKLRIITGRLIRGTFKHSDSLDEYLLSVVPRILTPVKLESGSLVLYCVLKWLFPRTREADCECQWFWSYIVIIPQRHTQFSPIFCFSMINQALFSLPYLHKSRRSASHLCYNLIYYVILINFWHICVHAYLCFTKFIHKCCCPTFCTPSKTRRNTHSQKFYQIKCSKRYSWVP